MQNTNEKTVTKKHWATKSWLAKHYDVSVRTITKWKAIGLLVGFKVGRVIRFDTAASDASLREYGMV
jgi:phage terminase Nu1 subunit (DNA packaging protein)